MKSHIKARKEAALLNLQKQLDAGTKPVNKRDYMISTTDPGVPNNDHLGNFNNGLHYGKPVKTNEEDDAIVETLKNGDKKPILLDFLPLDDKDIKRIKQEITNLKAKLKIS